MESIRRDPTTTDRYPSPIPRQLHPQVRDLISLMGKKKEKETNRKKKKRHWTFLRTRITQRRARGWRQLCQQQQQPPHLADLPVLIYKFRQRKKKQAKRRDREREKMMSVKCCLQKHFTPNLLGPFSLLLSLVWYICSVERPSLSR